MSDAAVTGKVPWSRLGIAPWQCRGLSLKLLGLTPSMLGCSPHQLREVLTGPDPEEALNDVAGTARRRVMALVEDISDSCRR